MELGQQLLLFLGFLLSEVILTLLKVRWPDQVHFTSHGVAGLVIKEVWFAGALGFLAFQGPEQLKRYGGGVLGLAAWAEIALSWLALLGCLLWILDWNRKWMRPRPTG